MRNNVKKKSRKERLEKGGTFRGQVADEFPGNWIEGRTDGKGVLK